MFIDLMFESLPSVRIEKLLSYLRRLQVYINSQSPDTPSPYLHVAIDQSLNNLNRVNLREINSESIITDVFFPLNFHMSEKRLDWAVNELSSTDSGPLKWLEMFPKMILLDIGANLGVYSSFCLGWGYKSVIAIDPLPSNYLSLLQVQLINPNLPFLSIHGACKPVFNLLPDSQKDVIYQKKFLHLQPTVGTFSGASQVKPIIDKHSIFPSLIVPSFSIIDLLHYALNTTKLTQSASVNDLVVKIDVDSIDTLLLYSLIESGVASQCKAIIVEDDSLFEHLITNDYLRVHGLSITDQSSGNFLIQPHVS